MDTIEFHEIVSHNEQMILKKPDQAEQLNRLQEKVIDYIRSGGVPVLDDATGLYIVPGRTTKA